MISESFYVISTKLGSELARPESFTPEALNLKPGNPKPSNAHPINPLTSPDSGDRQAVRSKGGDPRPPRCSRQAVQELREGIP